MKVIRNPAGQRHIPDTPAHPGNQRQGMTAQRYLPCLSGTIREHGLTYAK